MELLMLVSECDEVDALAIIVEIFAGSGFWNRYPKFATSGLANPWVNGSNFAPFDQEFYIIMNLAVGGVNFFSDTYVNAGNPKPW
jgi:hypothetical protein